MNGDFPKRLSNMIDINGMSQKEFSKKIGVTEATVSRYINGTKNPRIDIINKIAQLFDVSVDYLTGNNYKDDEYIDLYNRVHNDPDLKIFFNKTKDLTKEEMIWVLSIVDQVKKNK